MKNFKIHFLIKVFICVLVLLPSIGFAQNKAQTTESFTITGLLKKDITISIDSILKYKTVKIKDVKLVNHAGKSRRTLVKIKGILLKDILKNIVLDEDNPKLFSEFYFTFVANDNYKIVYSWNEIFNTSTGDNLYIITSENGKDIKDMEESLLILTPSDFKTGRRHIKGLQTIIVNRAK